MKISFILLLLFFFLQASSIHLRWTGGYAGRILMRAYSDPALQQAVKAENVGNDKQKLKAVIATKIGEILKKDPKSMERLANASFPDNKIGRVDLTQEQKIKLLQITIDNPQLIGQPKTGQFINLVGKEESLKNVYEQLLQRRKAFEQVQQKLISKVKADPLVASFIANGTKKTDPEYRKAFKTVSARIVKADPQLQKIVAKSRFGFDPVFSKLTDEQRVKLLNILIDNNKTQTLRWKSPEYIRAVSEAIQNESTLKQFYEKYKSQIQNKIKLAEQRKARWLARHAGGSHLETLNDLVEAGVSHFRLKTLPSSEILLQRLKQHPSTKAYFSSGQIPNSDVIKSTTIQIINSDEQLKRQLANDMFSRGEIGALMNDGQRQALLQLTLNNPSFFSSNASKGILKKGLVDLMLKDPVLSKFYRNNEKKILANMG